MEITFLTLSFPIFQKCGIICPINLSVYNCKLQELKIDLKPPKIKNNSYVRKIRNCLLTRIRVGRSDLNLHKFTIGQADNPECLCHFKEESPKHFFLDCFLYTAERQTLFSLVEHYIPKFSSLSK